MERARSRASAVAVPANAPRAAASASIPRVATVQGSRRKNFFARDTENSRRYARRAEVVSATRASGTSERRVAAVSGRGVGAHLRLG